MYTANITDTNIRQLQTQCVLDPDCCPGGIGSFSSCPHSSARPSVGGNSRKLVLRHYVCCRLARTRTQSVKERRAPTGRRRVGTETCGFGVIIVINLVAERVRTRVPACKLHSIRVSSTRR